MTDPAGYARQLPMLEPETAFYWTSGADGRLRIQRCGACLRYQHPPLPICPNCRSRDVGPEPVSGRGRVATFTINRQPWRAGQPVPFVFAAIELEEQAELYVLSNVVNLPVEEVSIGIAVEVLFERHGAVHLPLFAPAEALHG